VKGFASPPEAVKVVLEAVCILLGEKPDWDNAKRVMGGSDFLERLMKYDKDNIDPKPLAKIRSKYIDHPLMKTEDVQRKSAAAGPMCSWVHAVNTYSLVAKDVEPKKQRLAEMNAQLDEAKAALKIKQDSLQEVLDKLAGLQRTASETQAEKKHLERTAQLTKDRLGRADKLTTGLADEQVRWKQSVELLAVQIERLVGDVLLAAGLVSYAGPFTGPYRDQLLASWLEACKESSVPASDAPTLLHTLGDPV